MARIFDGIDDYLAADQVDLSATTLVSLSFWLWWDTFANDDRLAFEFTLNYSSTAGGFIFDPNDSRGAAAFGMGNGGGSFWVDSFTRPSAGAWHHYLLTFDRATPANAAWVDGSSQSLTTITHGVLAGNFTKDWLVFMSRAGTSLFGLGRMAEVGLYTGVLLGQDDASALATGYSPLLVRPTSLAYYWPLRSRLTDPEIELRQANPALLGVGSGVPALTEHPRVIYPSRRRVQRWPAAGAARRYLLVRN